MKFPNQNLVSDQKTRVHAIRLIMFISSFVVISTNAFVFYKHAHSVVALFNGLIEYEERHHQRHKDKIYAAKSPKGTQLVCIMVQMMTLTGIFMPTLYHLDMIRNPCFPVYLGYWLSPQCESGKLGHALPATWSGIELGTKIGMYFLSYLNWNLLMTGLPFFVNVAYTIHGHCCRSYIAQYGKDMQTCVGSKSIEFQKWIRRQTRAFKELQLISIQHRKIYSQYALAVSLICCITMQVVCLYNTVTVFLKSGNAGKEEDMQIGLNLVYMWCTMVAACAILVLYGIMADVYKVGRKVHEDLGSNVELKRSIWFRRFLKSCPILRIYLSGTNFVDELTPLVSEDFAIDQTVSLMLLK